MIDISNIVKQIKLIILWTIMFSSPTLAQESITKNGVEFNWSFKSDSLTVEVIAPTNGWVAIGFNHKKGLAGTNLIMGAAEYGYYKLDDRYIVVPGIHKEVSELKGTDCLSNRKVFEKKGKTVMRFTIPVKPEDEFHQHLNKGQVINILLAYSTSDDFHHHSRMRTSINLKL